MRVNGFGLHKPVPHHGHRVTTPRYPLFRPRSPKTAYAALTRKFLGVWRRSWDYSSYCFQNLSSVTHQRNPLDICLRRATLKPRPERSGSPPANGLLGSLTHSWTGFGYASSGDSASCVHAVGNSRADSAYGSRAEACFHGGGSHRAMLARGGSPTKIGPACLPLAYPSLGQRLGKQKASRRTPFIRLKSLRDFGAGEGIRTLDPNLGKVVLYP
jgi:hypothetical protein